MSEQLKVVVQRKCMRCGYDWEQRLTRLPSDKKPKQCPHCKSPKWDHPLPVPDNTPGHDNRKKSQSVGAPPVAVAECFS